MAVGKSTKKAAAHGTQGDPSDDAGRETRQKLIDAATDLFLDVGYSGLRIGDITDYAGVAKGTFYLYFESKRELLLAYFRHISEQVDAVEAQVAAPDLDYPSAVAVRLKAATDPAGKWHKQMTFLRILANSKDPEVSEAAWQLHRRIAAPSEKLFSDAAREGLARDLDPELAILAFVGMQEVLAWRAARDDTYDHETLIAFLADAYTRAFLRGSGEDERHTELTRSIRETALSAELPPFLRSLHSGGQ